MQRVLVFLSILLIPILIAVFIVKNYGNSGELVKNEVFVKSKMDKKAIYHFKLEELQKQFESGPEVTKACLSCHTERGKELLHTSHWLWQREEEIEGKGIVPIGKRNILNNFCIGTRASEATCTRCHIGYGWENKDFDFSNPENIDCLVCHDNTGTYKKESGVGGQAKTSVDLTFVARNVGLPTKENCGVCHFWGGGGNNVKHGDLEIALLDCTEDVDVHMAKHGLDMTCTDCHVTENHQMAGKLYALSSENKSRATCAQCHTKEPHADKILNEHNLRVACQTCHIPQYAKVNSTKMIWDWSTAGILDDQGEPMHWNDADGNHKYMGIKGTFIWDDHVIPEYYWFNGIADHQLIEDKIKDVPVQMNTLSGSYCDKGKKKKSAECSKIWPVKVHRGKQIYDTKNMTLIQPKLWDKEKGKGAYWKDFDWQIASQKGMEYIGQAYSGEYGFVETEMYWPLSHMVSPKEESLKCKDCHIRNNGRLESLSGFYMPGRDRILGLDIIGILLIIFSFIGVSIHLICRISMKKNCVVDQLIKGEINK
ncbi:MAG: tetrathionate reductase family octaheme c-type cytochrome [Bacteroidetes bacterium]|nr:tetrathionate reductase family octaheme c-type cytochrome [Bacteroidota bacterium]